MPRFVSTLYPLAFALALSGCAANSAKPPAVQACPRLPEPPPEAMAAPNYESTLRQLLLEPEPGRMPRSGSSSR